MYHSIRSDADVHCARMEQHGGLHVVDECIRALSRNSGRLVRDVIRSPALLHDVSYCSAAVAVWRASVVASHLACDSLTDTMQSLSYPASHVPSSASADVLTAAPLSYSVAVNAFLVAAPVAAVVRACVAIHSIAPEVASSSSLPFDVPALPAPFWPPALLAQPICDVIVSVTEQVRGAADDSRRETSARGASSGPPGGVASLGDVSAVARVADCVLCDCSTAIARFASVVSAEDAVEIALTAIGGSASTAAHASESEASPPVTVAPRSRIGIPSVSEGVLESAMVGVVECLRSTLTAAHAVGCTVRPGVCVLAEVAGALGGAFGVALVTAAEGMTPPHDSEQTRNAAGGERQKEGEVGDTAADRRVGEEGRGPAAPSLVAPADAGAVAQRAAAAASVMAVFSECVSVDEAIKVACEALRDAASAQRVRGVEGVRPPSGRGVVDQVEAEAGVSGEGDRNVGHNDGLNVCDDDRAAPHGGEASPTSAACSRGARVIPSTQSSVQPRMAIPSVVCAALSSHRAALAYAGAVAQHVREELLIEMGEPSAFASVAAAARKRAHARGGAIADIGVHRDAHSKPRQSLSPTTRATVSTVENLLRTQRAAAKRLYGPSVTAVSLVASEQAVAGSDGAALSKGDEDDDHEAVRRAAEARTRARAERRDLNVEATSVSGADARDPLPTSGGEGATAPTETSGASGGKRAWARAHLPASALGVASAAATATLGGVAKVGVIPSVLTAALPGRIAAVSNFASAWTAAAADTLHKAAQQVPQQLQTASTALLGGSAASPYILSPLTREALHSAVGVCVEQLVVPPQRPLPTPLLSRRAGEMLVGGSGGGGVGRLSDAAAVSHRVATATTVPPPIAPAAALSAVNNVSDTVTLALVHSDAPSPIVPLAGGGAAIVMLTSTLAVGCVSFASALLGSATATTSGGSSRGGKLGEPWRVGQLPAGNLVSSAHHVGTAHAEEGRNVVKQASSFLPSSIVPDVEGLEGSAFAQRMLALLATDVIAPLFDHALEYVEAPLFTAATALEASQTRGRNAVVDKEMSVALGGASRPRGVRATRRRGEVDAASQRRKGGRGMMSRDDDAGEGGEAEGDGGDATHPSGPSPFSVRTAASAVAAAACADAAVLHVRACVAAATRLGAACRSWADFIAQAAPVVEGVDGGDEGALGKAQGAQGAHSVSERKAWHLSTPWYTNSTAVAILGGASDKRCPSGPPAKSHPSTKSGGAGGSVGVAVRKAVAPSVRPRSDARDRALLLSNAGSALTAVAARCSAIADRALDTLVQSVSTSLSATSASLLADLRAAAPQVGWTDVAVGAFHDVARARGGAATDGVDVDEPFRGGAAGSLEDGLWCRCLDLPPTETVQFVVDQVREEVVLLAAAVGGSVDAMALPSISTHVRMQPPATEWAAALRMRASATAQDVGAQRDPVPPATPILRASEGTPGTVVVAGEDEVATVHRAALCEQSQASRSALRASSDGGWPSLREAIAVGVSGAEGSAQVSGGGAVSSGAVAGEQPRTKVLLSVAASVVDSMLCEAVVQLLSLDGGLREGVCVQAIADATALESATGWVCEATRSAVYTALLDPTTATDILDILAANDASDALPPCVQALSRAAAIALLQFAAHR